jgi:putative transposase
LRGILDAVFYVVRSGCAWRLLPHDFPPWKTVYHYFRSWRLDGTWERMHLALRKRVRVRLQRDPQPAAAIVDSQSVKSTGVGAEEPGYDAAKKVKGRKRPLLVDTQGLVLMAKVHRANVTARDGIKLLLEPAKIGFLTRALMAAVAGRLSTREKIGVPVGCRRRLGGARRSSSTLPSRPPRR